MREILHSIRNFFFYSIVSDINLYTILSTVLKVIFVLIVLYYIYIIVKLIVLDIHSIDYKEKVTHAYLIYEDDSKNKKKYLLENLNTIGRNISNDIIFKNSLVSNYHAKIVKSDDAYYLIDNDSSNGTMLNGEYINKNLELLDGDIITIANNNLYFVEEVVDKNKENQKYDDMNTKDFKEEI